MTDDFSTEIQRSAMKAVAPILLAAGGAFDAPKVDPAKASAALTKLGIPQTGKVIITFAHDLCTTHDFRELEKAAAQNNAKLYVIYGNPNEPGLEKPENQNKVSIGVIENGTARSLKAEKIILAKNGNTPLTVDELTGLANTLGFTVKREAGGISSSNGSAIYENGSFQRIVPRSTTVKTTLNAPAFEPADRSRFARA